MIASIQNTFCPLCETKGEGKKQNVVKCRKNGSVSTSSTRAILLGPYQFLRTCKQRQFLKKGVTNFRALQEKNIVWEMAASNDIHFLPFHPTIY
mmetsp:Transcript_9152/g.12721  ORF Transcript_9152/g.12721 Transcript_9152/m.12721 type:complete len:94 (-) Transcript_9152:1793-2074(-)